jgi:hypothetical protein
MSQDAPTVAVAPPCAGCGGGDALDFGTTWLCLACYHVSGSTCAGAPRADDAATDPGPAGVC